MFATGLKPEEEQGQYYWRVCFLDSAVSQKPQCFLYVSVFGIDR